MWLCFLVRGFFYATLLPLWEGYDEHAHFAFVQHVATHAGLPVAAGTRTSREVEESFRLAPMPWMERQSCAPPCRTHDDYWRLSSEERERRGRQLRSLPPSAARELAATNRLIYEAHQPPLYYWLLAPPLRATGRMSLPARVVLLRYLTVALASLAIPLGFLLARRALGHETAALGVMALVAAMPELLLNVSRISNESLAIVLYTLLVYLSLRPIESASSAGVLGAVLGLGVLTKVYFVTAVPALLLVLVWNLRKQGLLRAALAFSVAALFSGWWFWRNLRLTGSWSGLMHAVALRDTSAADLLRLVPRVDWRAALDSTFVSHIWFGNWSFLQVRSWMYHFFGYVVIAAALGLLALLGRRGDKTLRDRLLVLLAFYGFFLLGVGYHVLMTFAVSGSSSSAGWYIYCLVVPEVVLATAGLRALVPERYGTWVLPAATLCFCALELYATHFLLLPYYTGFIAHRPDGALAAFHLGQLRGDGLATLLLRLEENKPAFIGSWFVSIAWLLFLAATLGLVAIQVRLSVTIDHHGRRG